MLVKYLFFSIFRHLLLPKSPNSHLHQSLKKFLFKINSLEIYLINSNYVINYYIQKMNSFNVLCFCKYFKREICILFFLKKVQGYEDHDHQAIDTQQRRAPPARPPQVKRTPKIILKKNRIFMSSGRYLCIVYVKLRINKQNSIDRIIIVKRKANFTISTTKNYLK